MSVAQSLDSSHTTLTKTVNSQNSDKTIVGDLSQDKENQPIVGSVDENELHGRPIRRSKVDAELKIKAMNAIFVSGQAGLRCFSPLDEARQERVNSLAARERKRRAFCKKLGVTRLGDLVKRPKLLDDTQIVNNFSSTELCLLASQNENDYFSQRSNQPSPVTQVKAPPIPPIKEEKVVTLQERVARIHDRIDKLQRRLSFLPKMVGKGLLDTIKEELKRCQANCGLYGRPVAQSTPVCSIYNAGIDLGLTKSEATFQP